MLNQRRFGGFSISVNPCRTGKHKNLSRSSATDLEGVLENSNKRLHWKRKSLSGIQKPDQIRILDPADLKESLHLLPDVLHLVQNFDLPVVLPEIW